MSRFSRTLRFRLTAWYTLAMAALLATFSYAVFSFVQLRASRLLTARLNDQYSALVDTVREDPDVEEFQELDRVGLTDAFEVRRDGEVLYSSRNWGAVIPGPNPTRHTRPSGLTAEPAAPFRIRRGAVERDGHHFDIAVAVSEWNVRSTLHTLAGILACGAPIALLIAIGGGWWLASRALKPVSQITARAREINAEHLAQRLPIPNADDEIGQLALVFNEVLARLEQAFDRLRSFTTDASHELRTPLTALRGVGEVALQDGRDAAGCREAIGSMLEEADRLVTLLDSLLELTRADADRAIIHKTNFDLAAVARDAAELLRVLADEKQQSLKITAGDTVLVRADPQLLRQAILNLADNAIKFTPERGEIRVDIRREPGGAAVVEIADNGPGIAPEHRERVFERFYRVNRGAGAERGAGLGLPIARWAVEANDGWIELGSQLGRGSVFRIVLPSVERA